MTTSDASWSPKLRQIGDLERQDHWYLGPNDQCFYFGEYAPRRGFSHSTTNQLVVNLKKKPELRHTLQWNHKLAAIDQVARTIAANILPEYLPGLTFVPIPPSKPPTSPDYDDRMAQVARRIGPACDVRELIVTTSATLVTLAARNAIPRRCAPPSPCGPTFSQTHRARSCCWTTS